MDIELAIVAEYNREQEARKAEQLHWIANELEGAFS